MKNLMSTKQAAEYLTKNGYGMKPSSLNMARSRGIGPSYFKIGRRVFYSQRQLDEFLRGKTKEVRLQAA